MFDDFLKSKAAFIPISLDELKVAEYNSCKYTLDSC